MMSLTLNDQTSDAEQFRRTKTAAASQAHVRSSDGLVDDGSRRAPASMFVAQARHEMAR